MSKNLKICLAPYCKSTSVDTPEKLLIKLPNDPKRRNVWILLAERNPSEMSNKKNLFLCQDHFNLENDMENYIQYKIMGSVRTVKMKPDCLPSRFKYRQINIYQPATEESSDEEVEHCMTEEIPSHDITLLDTIKTEVESPTCSLQAAKIKEERISFEMTIDENWVVPPSASYEQDSLNVDPLHPPVIKKERLSSDQDNNKTVEKNWGLKPLSSYKLDVASFKNNISFKPMKVDKGTQTAYLVGKQHKVVQTSNIIHYRSKQVQCTPKMRDSMTSPIKFAKSFKIRQPLVNNKYKLKGSKNKSATFININKRKQFLVVRKSSDDDDDD